MAADAGSLYYYCDLMLPQASFLANGRAALNETALPLAERLATASDHSSEADHRKHLPVNIFEFSVISQHWDDAGSWNPSSWQT